MTAADEEAITDEGASPTAEEEADDAVAVTSERPTLPPTGGREMGWPAAEHSWTTALETAVSY